MSKYLSNITTFLVGKDEWKKKITSHLLNFRAKETDFNRDHNSLETIVERSEERIVGDRSLDAQNSGSSRVEETCGRKTIVRIDLRSAERWANRPLKYDWGWDTGYGQWFHDHCRELYGIDPKLQTSRPRRAQWFLLFHVTVEPGPSEFLLHNASRLFPPLAFETRWPFQGEIIRDPLQIKRQ